MHVTCSIGIAAYPEHGFERDELVTLADQAMYTAKRLGRNQVRSVEEALSMPADEHHEPQNAAELVGTVHALSELVRVRDAYTGKHVDIVEQLSKELAEALGCEPNSVEMIGLAGRLHDIGKVAIPDAILGKQDRLTDEEWTVMRRHSAISADVIAHVPALRSLQAIVRGHHEKWDGTGYPDRRAGVDIPFGSRVIAVVDAYSAMIHERPYQEPRSHDDAMRELYRCAGTQFDPTIVAAFETLMRVAEHLEGNTSS